MLWMNTTKAPEMEVGWDMCVRCPQFCISALTLDSWNLGEWTVGSVFGLGSSETQLSVPLGQG